MNESLPKNKIIVRPRGPGGLPFLATSEKFSYHDITKKRVRRENVLREITRAVESDNI
jgi:hypothetical protein